ncbi:hypothetical protein A0H81_10502 [Grifola frondosa]|uniref:RNase H type-1 domain-containing protein n=1 Tax=Grifola frondosa TaxID=5627 RepID=A0A1C7M0C2_GRIFR|nr:hypothetical protein A0H81_10502 [Grifola frondosa]
MRGVPAQITEWLRAKLRGRKTKLMFDDHASDAFEIHSGIDQGCPLSVILYQFYNSDLISGARLKEGELAVGTMDDVAVIATAKTFGEAHDKLRSFMTRRKGALTWSESHNSEFSFDKLGLLNCSNKLKDLGPALQLNDSTVQPSKSHKFLGVLLDHKLNFHEHVAYALAKGTSWVAQFQQLAKSRYGLNFGLVKRLYLAVAVPSMLYAVDIFLTPVRMLPGGKRLHGSVGAVRRLERVQRQALIIMTGAMRTTATDIMCAHANLLPFTLLVDKICHRAITRICTLPETHPLHRHLRWAGRKFVANHRSALTELLFAYNLHAEYTETILPTRFHPRWKPPHNIEIASDKEEAIRKEQKWQHLPGMRVYSDGSDIDGGVGAAAVLFKPGRPGYSVLRFHLGPSTDHSVYEAEIAGLILGSELLKEEQRVEEASIAADNKSSIQATKLRRPASGHYLMDYLHKRLRMLSKKHREAKITLRWVPGHVDVEGNEIADQEAKRAARGDSSPDDDLPALLRDGLSRSVTKMRQTFLADLQEKAKKTWTSSNRAKKFSRLDKQLPSKRYEKLIGKLPRRQANLLFQLRTEHVPLQKHLHRIRRADTPICPSCLAAPETVHHFLLTCPAHAHHRWDHLDRSLGRAGRSLNYLLNTSSALKPLFSYINATGRLQQTFGDVTSNKRTGKRPTREVPVDSPS